MPPATLRSPRRLRAVGIILMHTVRVTPVASVRLKAGMTARDRIVVRHLIEEIEISAVMEAKARGNKLSVITEDGDATVEADRQILASTITNLVQNAFKHTHAGSLVVLRSSATAASVRIEVEDECGGLPPGKAELLFKPFAQKGSDRSGLGLGLRARYFDRQRGP